MFWKKTKHYKNYFCGLKSKKFDFNGLDNGIPLQKKRLKYEITGHAKHPDYDKALEEVKKLV